MRIDFDCGARARKGARSDLVESREYLEIKLLFMGCRLAGKRHRRFAVRFRECLADVVDYVVWNCFLPLESRWRFLTTGGSSTLKGNAMKLKRAKVQSQSLLSRLGGISAFGFGVSFKAPEPERQVVRDVITSLEDKRALYVGAISEQPDHVVSSVMDMRRELTAGLKRV